MPALSGAFGLAHETGIRLQAQARIGVHVSAWQHGALATECAATTVTGEKTVPSEDLQALLRTAIEAARSGDRAKAREILRRLVLRDPGNELAWLWLASVASSEDERRQCLRRVLIINPRNERARQALAQLDLTAQQPSAAVPVTAESQRALRPPTSRRRGMSSWLFWTLTVTAFGLVLAALLLWWQDRRSVQKSTPTPAIGRASCRERV